LLFPSSQLTGRKCHLALAIMITLLALTVHPSKLHCPLLQSPPLILSCPSLSGLYFAPSIPQFGLDCTPLDSNPYNGLTSPHHLPIFSFAIYFRPSLQHFHARPYSSKNVRHFNLLYIFQHIISLYPISAFSLLSHLLLDFGFILDMMQAQSHFVIQTMDYQSADSAHTGT
jgi:hypothetical protein